MLHELSVHSRRECDDPSPQNGGTECSGCHLDFEVCNAHPCAEVKKTGPWTPWMIQVNGSTLNGGQLERRFRYSCKANVADANWVRIALDKEQTRICQGDGSCQRFVRHTQLNIFFSFTNLMLFFSILHRSGEGANDEMGWGEWGTWSTCSIECGGGQQFRTRLCEKSSCDGTGKMARACNTHSCKGKSIQLENKSAICYLFICMFRRMGLLE